MRKLVFIFIVLMFVVSNSANASVTIVDLVDHTDGQSNTYFFPYVESHADRNQPPWSQELVANN